ncbi:hypothetical protein EPD60_13900 [Flaviaesturariibacter flavus]|uniref:Uncharacterized protein n=1 Tax=Flaviaesturariibacter flavus TaxID=2502780 RepID=A0A4R1B8P8_9BACT|nr:hypothetical protein [Flaviaesturariibacter flavus]TCJ13155.1 hypothetical protein EPD60_13900 [Flaviaesturariibacter flavus]
MNLRLSLLVLAYTFPASLFAQKAFPPGAEMKWSIASLRTTSKSKESTIGYMLDPRAWMVQVGENEVALAQDLYDLKTGVCKVNQDGRVLWSTPVDGRLMHLSRLGEHILAFYFPPKKGNEYDRELKAMLIDARSGRILRENSIVKSGEESNLLDLQVLKDDEGVFQALIVRETEANKIRRFQWEDINNTSKIEALNLDANLAISGRTELAFPGLKQSELLHIHQAKSGKFILGFFAGDQLVAYRYTSSGAADGRLVLTLPDAKAGRSASCLIRKGADDEQLLASANYGSVTREANLLISRFDFRAMKASYSVQELNRAFSDQLHPTPVSFSVSSPKLHKNIGSLLPEGLFEKGDTLFALSEIYYSTGDGYRSSSVTDAAVLQAFDKSLRPIGAVALGKYFTPPQALGGSTGWKRYGNQLYLTGTVVDGAISTKNYFASVDLEKLSVASPQALERSGVKSYAAINGARTIFFPKSMLLVFVEAMGLTGAKTSTWFQKVDLP